MHSSNIVFIAFQEQDNLGIGYISSVLMDAGYRVKIIDFRVGTDRIVEEIRASDPLAIGISIIFQYHLFEFQSLVQELRDAGVDCHICAGGHYPSLRYEQLLEIIPSLDSVVLFEGEWTFLELVEALAAGADWKTVHGIAYLEGETARATPLRPLEADLDRFPVPLRPPLRTYSHGRKYATLLAGRGCVYDCNFCSIREFYGSPPGAVKRLRRPEMVVEEMKLLHQELGCSIFMFQDDDFPLAGRRGRAWVADFCRALDEASLSDEILWKVNCRPDEVRSSIFRELKARGLFLVYLGIESGTDEGLRLMNKRTDAATNLRGVQRLKGLDIAWDYGFMLFDPSSTYESIGANLDFLETICGDGSSPVTFCKMLPYAETRVEKELAAAGRLKGRIGFQDYDFLEPSLDRMYAFVTDCFGSWIGGHNGVLNLARWARYHLAAGRKFRSDRTELEELDSHTRTLIAESNRFCLDAIREAAACFADGLGGAWPRERLARIKRSVDETHQAFRGRVGEVIERLTGQSLAA